MNTIVAYFIYPLSPILALTAAAVVLLLLECLPNSDSLRRGKLWVSLAGTIASGLCLWHLFKDWPITFATVGYPGGIGLAPTVRP